MGARGLWDSRTEGPRKPDQSGRLLPAAPPSTPRLPRRAVRGRHRPGPHAAGARRSRRAPRRRRLPAPLPLGAGSAARGRAERRESGRCLTAVGRRRTVAAESRRRRPVQGPALTTAALQETGLEPLSGHWAACQGWGSGDLPPRFVSPAWGSTWHSARPRLLLQRELQDEPRCSRTPETGIQKKPQERPVKIVDSLRAVTEYSTSLIFFTSPRKRMLCL
ncbi:uncharacterized protein LOC132372812 [Balaenoptera ricei]|uniref:uncharacterized protein LOC132372812 n=1 Tax=Balaenoptera ricei TaxID=2746895 RepID=UPI0028BE661A|nr:uncharacterized protein LOC132372812 [Balaenoptera ricei]